MSRPEPLFPLFASLETLDGVGPKTATAFAALNVERPKDLLFLLPHSGIDRARKHSVRDVIPPTTITVEVTVGGHFPPRSKGKQWRTGDGRDDSALDCLLGNARRSRINGFKQRKVGGFFGAHNMVRVHHLGNAVEDFDTA